MACSQIIKKIEKLILMVPLVLTMVGCVAQHNNVKPDNKLTLGKVQKEIRVGMSSSDIISILGSPNIVTTDDQRRETWVYDRISTNISQQSAVGGLIIFGAAASETSTSQKSFTVIIKFDKDGKVRDLSYHSSKF